MKQRVEITFETEQTIVLRDTAGVSYSFCVNCGDLVVMSQAHIAAFLSGITERELFRLVEAGEVHFSENGRMLICVESLRNLKRRIDL